MKEKPVNETRELASMEKNAGERLVLRDSTFNGYRFLDLRTDFRDKAGEYHPTRKGLSLSVDQWLAVLPLLQSTLLEMEATLTKQEDQVEATA
ncbi:MAG: hypothetical protein HIU83_15755 [Proteobacteria bacterium]|nr:hypothetical protein [Pseudomonadota bacterium]